MRKHFILVELEAEDVETQDVVGMVDHVLHRNLGPDTGKKRVTSLPEDEALVRWKSSNFDDLMRQFLAWSKGKGLTR